MERERERERFGGRKREREREMEWERNRFARLEQHESFPASRFSTLFVVLPNLLRSKMLPKND